MWFGHGGWDFVCLIGLIPADKPLCVMIERARNGTRRLPPEAEVRERSRMPEEPPHLLVEPLRLPSRLTNLFLFIHAVFRKSAKSFLHREVVEIFGRVIADDRYFDISALDPRLESVVVESTKFLEPYRHEIPSSFRDSFARLKERLAQGCVLFLVRAPKEDGLGHEMIGYSLAERGVFSALGIRKRISTRAVDRIEKIVDESINEAVALRAAAGGSAGVLRSFRGRVSR